VNMTRTRVARILMIGATLGMTIGAVMLEAASASASAGVSEATLTDLSDGDSFHVDIAGTPDEVRLIGIDTPEIGSCEAQAAKDRLGEFLANGFTLVGGAANDRDRYGRLLRYAQIAVDPADDIDGYPDGTLDVGAALVADGYAIARYDSRDGYGTHDRQDAYWNLDALSPPTMCTPEQADAYAADQAQADQAQADQAQADQAQAESATPVAPAQPAPAVTVPAVNPPTVDAPAAPTPTVPVVVAPPPDGNDNPYDDGGPRNPDGSCPPGGCWPGT
jgi:endonuclease YncB( thermonuclease family)